MSKMAVCIYCKKDSSNAQSLEHIIPETLGCRKTLPKGYVCDSCNNYFSEIDKNILLNRYIALHVGTEQIPGKKGKIRRRIGENLRFPTKGAFEIDLGRITITSGMKQANFKLEQSKEFDELLFARGIHKIAFNSYAFRFGQSDALRSNFDNIRRYIRKADRNELWTYAVKISEDTENEFKGVIRKANWGEIVELHILCLYFLASFTDWNKKIESDLKGDNIYIIRSEGQWEASSFLGLKQ
jgi:hypothetical protein